jgi:hypothetical protein
MPPGRPFRTRFRQLSSKRQVRNGVLRALFDVAALPIRLTLRERRIVRVARGRGAVEILRPRLIERCVAAYALGKVRICDVVSTEGDKVAGSFGYKAGTMLGVDPDIQDERSRVSASEMMHDGISAHVLKRTPIDHSANGDALIRSQKLGAL